MTVWLMRLYPGSAGLHEFVGMVGLGLITYCVVGYDASVPFPGSNALAPCIGSALCIYASRSRLTGTVLSNRVLVGVGLISYSLYLVHWPVRVFYKHSVGGRDFSLEEMIFLVLASFAIAIFMFQYVEQPFRRGKLAVTRFIVDCTTLSILTAVLAASMWMTGGWEWRAWAASSSLSAHDVELGKQRRFHIREKLCMQKGWDKCDDILPGKVNALILGDSHAADALNAFEYIYPMHNFSMSTHTGCPPHRNIETLTLPNHPDRLLCKQLNLRRYDLTYLRQFDYIVINVLFSWYTPEHLIQYLDYLYENQISKVIVLGSYFTLNRDMYEILNEHGYNTTAVMSAVLPDPEHETLLETHVMSLGYFFLSKRRVFCQSGQCEIFDENHTPFTYDLHHLSYEFATRLGSGSKHALDQYIGIMGTYRG